MRIAPFLLAAALAGLVPAAAVAQSARVVIPVSGAPRAPAGARWSHGVGVDADALGAAARDGRAVELEVAPGTVYRTTADRVAWRGAGRFSWFGVMDGGGRATLTVDGPLVYGRLVTPAGVVMIEPAGAAHVAYAPIPVEGEGDDTLAPPTPAGVAFGGGEELFPDELHLAIFYTSQVADSLGDGLAVFLQATSDQLSDVLANSNVAFSARLVLTRQVVHTETQQLSGNLFMLQDPADGVMDEVHALRDETSADFVALLVETGTNSATGCGVAYLMSSLDPGFESAAFSVTKRRCAPELVFSHEVGHNLGLHHDTYVAPGPGLFAYSHGYVNIDSMNVPPGRPGIRTPLAYHSRCSDAGGECMRIPYYSTVEQLFNGQVIGDAVTADNVRTVRQSAALAAGFRAPVLLASESGDTAAGATWQRPECTDPGDVGTCVPSGSATAVPYAATGFEVTRTGRHYVRGTASFDGVLLVYAGAFDPGSPLTGLVGYAEPDPTAPASRRLLLPADLEQSAPYVLVTTGLANGDAGSYANDIFGPGGGGVIVGLEGGPSGVELTLTAPIPNPATDGVTFTVVAGRAQNVQVDVFDALGRRVARLLDGRIAAGAPVRLDVDARGLAPGAYVVRAVGEAGATSRRISVMR